MSNDLSQPGFTGPSRPRYIGSVFRRRILALVLVSLAAACARDREYELRGQIVALHPERREITIKHEDIRGFIAGKPPRVIS